MASPQVPTDDVLAPLEMIAGRGYSTYDVFRDWTELMLAALQDDDETYLNVLKEYDRGKDRDRGERNADLFAQAFGELQATMRDTGLDVLGAVYEAWDLSSHDQGVHFTPHSVARALAKFQVYPQDGEATLEPPVRIADPACGSGRLLIFAARVQDESVICYAKDQNSVCARMAALNCCFFNLDAVIVQGDSLQITRQRAWRTRHTPLGGEIVEVDPERLPDPEVMFRSTSDETTDEVTAPKAEPTAPTEADGRTPRGREETPATADRLTVEDGDNLEQHALDEF